MTRPLLRRGRDLARTGGPVLSDGPPGRSATVLSERDPITGRWLPGDPAGRADKGRQANPRLPRTVALAAAGAIVAAGAVVTVWLVGGDDGGAPAAQPAASSAPAVETSAEPTPEPTPEPPPFAGPRTVPITLTTTTFTPPPGFGPDASLGSVGEVRPRSWELTGPCDGTGSCTVVHCRAPGDCRPPLDAVPTGTGEYVITSTNPPAWQNASCSGGLITATITFRVSGPPETPSVTGTWVESADPVVLPGPARCGIYLGTFTFASA